MKNIFLTLIILTSTNAFAKSSGSIDMSEYNLLKSIILTSDYKPKPRTYPASDEDSEYDYMLLRRDPKAMTLQCAKTLSENKIAISTEISEATCSDVLIKNTIVKFDKYMRESGPNYHLHDFKIMSEIYCKPRSFSDSTLMSLFKKCQESPQQECFNPELIKQLNQVKRTTVTEVNDGNCNF